MNPSFPRSEQSRLTMVSTARPTAHAALKLLVKGFNVDRMERRLLEGIVRVSQRRQPRLDLLFDVEDQSADVVMIDSRDPQAMKWAAPRKWLDHKAVIWVDGPTARLGHTVIQRPVQWANLPMLLANALAQHSQDSADADNTKVHSDTLTSSALAQASRTPVLVVDDSRAARAHVRSLLEARGFLVIDADSGQDGIDAAAARPYACILMDVLMPGIDGYEACRRIKARARAGCMPKIVMLTSKSSPFDRIRGRMVGCDAYLIKPVDPKQLFAILSNCSTVIDQKGAHAPASGYRLAAAMDRSR